MPTGYTEAVQSGKITTFPEFALRCARAFGALITLRDESPNTPIPDELKVDDYYAEQIKNSRAELRDLQQMTLAKASEWADADFDKECRMFDERTDRRRAELARYTAMLEQVKLWTPPSTEHENMKAFMIEQLTSSIDHDCDGSYDKFPDHLNGEQWLAMKIQHAKENIEYAEKHHAEEVERVAGRNLWIKQLRESLVDSPVIAEGKS